MNKPVKKNQIDKIKEDLESIDSKGKRNRTGRFVVAALSSIPWVGGVIAASAAFHAEKEQGKVNELQEQWLLEHQRKIEQLGKAIYSIADRLDASGTDIDDRVKSEEYLALVQKGFKEWDNAETEEKRIYIQTLLTNAGAVSISTDDLVRLYIDWISTYHETHFAVIKEIHKRPGITRYDIWINLNGQIPRENTLESDFFKLLIRDLSTGGLIRQHRETDYYGNYVKKSTKRSKSSTLKSAFDDSDQYELTELGRNFVHYTMQDVVTQIGK